MDQSHGFISLFLAGGLAGSSIDLALHPLDYIKTRQHRAQALELSPRTVYKGLSASLAASFPCAATFWGFYMYSKKRMMDRGVKRIYAEPVAAVVGSFSCCVIRNPFERIKQIMQVSEKTSGREVLREVVKNQGVRGLYKGFSALCIRELPFDTIQMLLFQVLTYADFVDLGQFNYFCNGGIAGGITALVTCPIDVVKTRMMTSTTHFNTLAETARFLYKTEGVRTFWRGWQVRVTYITIGGMLYFGVFNSALKLISDTYP